MMSDINLTVRNEQKEDYRTVEQLVREAFWNLYVPGCNEHFVPHNLRKSNDFIPELDFVAEKEGQIVGQIAYTRGIIRGKGTEDKEVVTFGPISVLPALQRRGIGSALITHTTTLARRMGYPAICIYGDPRYYNRFGFRCGEKYEIKTAEDKFAVGLQVLALKQGALDKTSGRFIESAAYAVDETGFAQYDATFPSKEKKETESQREFRFMASLRY